MFNNHTQMFELQSCKFLIEFVAWMHRSLGVNRLFSILFCAKSCCSWWIFVNMCECFGTKNLSSWRNVLAHRTRKFNNRKYLNESGKTLLHLSTRIIRSAAFSIWNSIRPVPPFLSFCSSFGKSGWQVFMLFRICPLSTRFSYHLFTRKRNLLFGKSSLGCDDRSASAFLCHPYFRSRYHGDFTYIVSLMHNFHLVLVFFKRFIHSF